MPERRASCVWFSFLLPGAKLRCCRWICWAPSPAAVQSKKSILRPAHQSDGSAPYFVRHAGHILYLPFPGARYRQSTRRGRTGFHRHISKPRLDWRGYVNRIEARKTGSDLSNRRLEQSDYKKITNNPVLVDKAVCWYQGASYLFKNGLLKNPVVKE